MLLQNLKYIEVLLHVVNTLCLLWIMTTYLFCCLRSSCSFQYYWSPNSPLHPELCFWYCESVALQWFSIGPLHAVTSLCLCHSSHMVGLRYCGALRPVLFVLCTRIHSTCLWYHCWPFCKSSAFRRWHIAPEMGSHLANIKFFCICICTVSNLTRFPCLILSPWSNRIGWLDVKHQVTYFLILLERLNSFSTLKSLQRSTPWKPNSNCLFWAQLYYFSLQFLCWRCCQTLVATNTPSQTHGLTTATISLCVHPVLSSILSSQTPSLGTLSSPL